MTEVSLQLFRAGHLPVMGEWVALPLIEHSGRQASAIRQGDLPLAQWSANRGRLSGRWWFL